MKILAAWRYTVARQLARKESNMKIQSLSVVVPNKSCINHCASCPSRMHDNGYPVCLDKNRPDFDLYLDDYMKRLEYARDNGCDALMLTGTSEPQQNREFLTWFGMMMRMMANPFKNIEMQCTGALLDDNYITFLRRHVGVTLMALSLFSLDCKENRDIINPPKNIGINARMAAKKIKASDMSLRICLNLTKHFNRFRESPQDLFKILKEDYKADQVTFRVLYASDNDGPEDVWVRENRAGAQTLQAFISYIGKNGACLGQLPYGAYRYAVNGMSVVIDNDCMGKRPMDAGSYKYLILQPDCRLYSSWDDHGSLVF